MKFDQTLFNQLKEMHSFYDATNPDLSKFYKKGGKLILWHGWADQHISPVNTIEYHKAVQKFVITSYSIHYTKLYDAVNMEAGLLPCMRGHGSVVHFH